MLFKNHYSVMLKEAISALNINASGIYIDGTFGLGGHSKFILSKLGTKGRLVAIDRDWSSIQIGNMLAIQDRRFKIMHGSFSNILGYIKNMDLVGSIDGMLLDLGISSLQLADVNRGFSFLRDGFLDMRMDTSSGISAAKWLDEASQDSIAWVLRNLGEERFAKRIASVIVSNRKKNPILNSRVLSELITRIVPRNNINKHPATRSFLAIRVHINQELEEIQKILHDSLIMLSKKGRLVVISFNSVEDRLVKKFIHRHSSYIDFLPYKLPLTDVQISSMYKNKYKLKNVGRYMPSVDEINRNISSRSAVLRCVEKI